LCPILPQLKHLSLEKSDQPFEDLQEKSQESIKKEPKGKKTNKKKKPSASIKETPQKE
jgi:hypothetical protein